MGTDRCTGGLNRWEDGEKSGSGLPDLIAMETQGGIRAL